MKLLVSRNHNGLIVVEETDNFTIPFNGQGKDVASAIGNFFQANQHHLGIEIVINDSAKAVNEASRSTESVDLSGRGDKEPDCCHEIFIGVELAENIKTDLIVPVSKSDLMELVSSKNDK